MTRKKLDLFVKDRFGMNLCNFIKHKCEDESLFDCEIADLLSVSSSFVAKLRKSYGLKKIDGFRKRFDHRYGNGAVNQFKTLIEMDDMTLTDVAGIFGFSRENARIVYQKIYKHPYTLRYREKADNRKKREIRIRERTIRSMPIYRTIEKMKQMGFQPFLVKDGNACRIRLNGFKIVHKRTESPVVIGKKVYYRINTDINANKDSDFFICRCGDKSQSIHYIIPKNAIPKHTVSLSPVSSLRESKYAKYKEAWHLLRQGKI